MAQTYTYLGQITRGYFAYIDAETEQMLVAEPGGVYGIRTVDHDTPVPPPDGEWEETPPSSTDSGGGGGDQAATTSSTPSVSLEMPSTETDDKTGDQA